MLDATPRELRAAIIHIALLFITLAVAWEHDGPPADRAFWAIVAYFVEIAIYGVAEWILQARYGAPTDESPALSETTTDDQ